MYIYIYDIYNIVYINIYIMCINIEIYIYVCVYMYLVYIICIIYVYIFGWFVSRKNICVRVLHSCLQMFNVFSWLVRHDWDRLYWLLLRSAQKKPGKRNECQRSQD